MPGMMQRALAPLAAALSRLTRNRPQNVIYGTPLIERRGALPLELTGPPESLPAVYGVCGLLADALIALDWGITAPAANGGRELVDNPAAAALANWRKIDRWAWCWNALLSGNGVVHIRRGEDGAPHDLDVYPNGRAFLNLYSDNSIRYRLSPMAGESFEAPADDVIHLRYRPSGLDQRVGISPLLTASPTVAMLLATRAGTTSTMLNASRPSGYLTTDGRLDPQRAQELKDRWNDSHGEPNKRGGTAVLEQGLKYQVIDPTDLVKLASIETAQLGTAEIARLFAIPGAIIQADPAGAQRSSAAEDRRRLGAFAVGPLARLVEDAIAATLLTQRQRDLGLEVSVDTSVSLMGEGAEMADTMSKLVNAGIISPNEARAWLQYGSAGSDADTLRAPTNTWPIEAWAQALPRSSDSMSSEAARGVSAQGQRALNLITGGKRA